MNAPFIVIEQVENDGGAVPVDIAREQMRATIDLFIEQALQFHATPAPDTEVIDLDPNRRSMLGSIRPPEAEIRTGAAGRREVCVGAEVRRQSPLYRVIFLVPTHRLAEEASSKMLAVFGAHGISAAIYQSREAKDLKTGEPLCRNLEAVKAAQSIGADVQRTCCKKSARSNVAFQNNLAARYH